MKHIVKQLLEEYEVFFFKKLDEITAKRAEEIYDYFYKYSSSLQKNMLDWYGKNKSEYSYYLNALVHDLNTYAGNVLSNIRNYYWYKRHGKREAEGIKHKLQQSFSKFVLLLISLEVFYEHVYLENWEN